MRATRLTTYGAFAADSIYHDAETGILFATFKYVGYDYAGDMERMRENPKVREWWAMTDGYQEVSVQSPPPPLQRCAVGDTSWPDILSQSMVPGAKSSESGEPSWWKGVEEVFYQA